MHIDHDSPSIILKSCSLYGMCMYVCTYVHINHNYYYTSIIILIVRTRQTSLLLNNINFKGNAPFALYFRYVLATNDS